MTSSSWTEITFSEAFDINPRYQLKRGRQYPYIEMASVGENTGAISNIISREYTGGGARFSVGDTLFARITPCLENGKIAQVKTLEDEVGFGSTEFIVIRGRANLTDNDFAYYLSISPYVREFAIQHMTGTSGRQRVPTNVFDNLSILLPPLSEQRAIAHMLGSLDDKIEANRRENETLEATARAIFKSWFVDFDPVHAKSRGELPTGMDEETAQLFPDAFVESELGLIPQGWRVGTLAEDFNLIMGQSPPGDTYNEKGEGLPFYQGRRDFGFRYPNLRVFCSVPTRIATIGDTLVSVRAPVGDINMALEECCIGRGVASIRHKSGSRSYSYYSMLALGELFNNYDGEGTVFGSISSKDFNNIDMILPPIGVVRTFERILYSMDQAIETNELQIRTLTETRDALLPKLMSGELHIIKDKENAKHFIEIMNPNKKLAILRTGHKDRL